MGIAPNFGMAYYKAQSAAGSNLPLEGKVLISVCERDREAVLPIAVKLAGLGFSILATEGTGEFLNSHGLQCKLVQKLNEGRPNVADVIRNREAALIINTPIGRLSKIDDSYIRMLAIQYRVPYVTTAAAAHATVEGIAEAMHGASPLKSLQEYQSEA